MEMISSSDDSQSRLNASGAIPLFGDFQLKPTLYPAESKSSYPVKYNLKRLMGDVNSSARREDVTIYEKFDHNVQKKPVQRETIMAWWAGTVLEFSLEEQLFTAELTGDDGVIIRADFDFEDVFENDEDQAMHLFEGARFTFHIVKKHSAFGPPSTVSQIAFTPPYIWTEDDAARMQKTVEELFPE